ncbi:MAPEG family protein [Elongatibacter sediminis]|uniref:MAPEG family protein n=1 Tax=Elongatibacter sediminis TaxID=3119006 RepID=A0AAW9RA44_9GAMM
MFYQPLLLPLLVQVALTFAVWVLLYVTRLGEMGRKDIDPQRLTDPSATRALLTESAGPADNFRNLFEMPVLFYLAVVVSLVLLIQDSLLVQLAWAFVVLRVVHSFIQCTYNRVIHRFIAHAASSLMLALMWVRIGMFVFY